MTLSALQTFGLMSGCQTARDLVTRLGDVIVCSSKRGPAPGQAVVHLRCTSRDSLSTRSMKLTAEHELSELSPA